MVDVLSVEVLAGLKVELFRRHAKSRATAAWGGLVRAGEKLRKDPFYGTQIPKDRFPRAFREHGNLWKLDLPGAFHAVYTVLARGERGVVIGIEWKGDHKEYDRLFGYE